MNGLAQIGAPARTRSSTTSPTRDTSAVTTITAENSTSGRCHDCHHCHDRHDRHDRHGADVEDMIRIHIPLMDSGTRRYLIVPLSMMGSALGKGRAVGTAQARQEHGEIRE
ncbi:hypothetical protein GCM10017771_34770 [Streptomyces capitiformicae]|uniref:Uncharacterized protein n=1 Tax=Streptomyces capitiformicae TaxID=2014920 RepID=A0A919GPZ6_9ACTN|nr:hypothetical protein GCM10017771_34770 [Streptomyces capitiformicae]